MASDNETSCVSDPNFAVICSFLEKFAKSCGITHPNILELQEMLENSQEVPQPLIDLHVKLLRKARKSVSGERWEKAIIKFCHSYSNQDGWEIERFGYKKARIGVKLRILKMLLEIQFDLNTKFKTEVNRLSADELRCQPLGRDKMGQTYWCQLDEDCNLRVYREDLDDETWEIVASDREGLVQLISQLSSNDPFRKDTEALLNEDSNSLEIDKPIIDTGQSPKLPDNAMEPTDDEEFQEIDDEDDDESEGPLEEIVGKIPVSNNCHNGIPKNEVASSDVSNGELLEVSISNNEPLEIEALQSESPNTTESDIIEKEIFDETLKSEPTHSLLLKKELCESESLKKDELSVVEVSKVRLSEAAESENNLFGSELSRESTKDMPSKHKSPENELKKETRDDLLKEVLPIATLVKEELPKDFSSEKGLHADEAMKAQPCEINPIKKEVSNIELLKKESSESEQLNELPEAKVPKKESFQNQQCYSELPEMIIDKESIETDLSKKESKDNSPELSSRNESFQSALLNKELPKLEALKNELPNSSISTKDPLTTTPLEKFKIVTPKVEHGDVLKKEELPMSAAAKNFESISSKKAVLGTETAEHKISDLGSSKDEIHEPFSFKNTLLSMTLKNISPDIVVSKIDQSIPITSCNRVSQSASSKSEVLLPSSYGDRASQFCPTKSEGSTHSKMEAFQHCDLSKKLPTSISSRTEISLVSSCIQPENEASESKLLKNEIPQPLLSMSRELTTKSSSLRNKDLKMDKLSIMPNKKESSEGIMQNEYLGMDLSKSTRSRDLGSALSQQHSVGMDLSSKSYTEEQVFCSPDDDKTSSSLMAEDLSDASKRKVPLLESFQTNRFSALPFTPTDLSTKRSAASDLILSAKSSIMGVGSEFSSLPINCMSGKRLHESDMLTNEAKKLRLEKTVAANCNKPIPTTASTLSCYSSGSYDSEDSTEVGEAIEEPLMLVRGEGSGADCETGNPGKDEDTGKSCDTSSKEKITTDKNTNVGENSNKIKSSTLMQKGEKTHEASNVSGKVPKLSSSACSVKQIETMMMEAGGKQGCSTATSTDSSFSSGHCAMKCNLEDKEEAPSTETVTNTDAEKMLASLKSSTSLSEKTLITETSLQEKEFLQSNQTLTSQEVLSETAGKQLPKLWSIDTICSSVSEKGKDVQKSGTKQSGSSLLGVVSDSLYGERYNVTSSPTNASVKRPSRWDVSGSEKSPKRGEISICKTNILQKESTGLSMSDCKTSSSKILSRDEEDPKNAPSVSTCATDVASSDKTNVIDKPREQVCQKQKFKFDIENIITVLGEKQNKKLLLKPTFDIKANKYIDQLQIPESTPVDELVSPEKPALREEEKQIERKPSEKILEGKESYESEVKGDGQLPAQGFFFGPGCLMKSPIKKAESSTAGGAEDLDTTGLSQIPVNVSGCSPDGVKIASTEIGKKSELLKDIDSQSGTLSEIPSSPSFKTLCSKPNTLHSIDTIMMPSSKLLDSTNLNITCKQFRDGSLSETITSTVGKDTMKSHSLSDTGKSTKTEIKDEEHVIKGSEHIKAITEREMGDKLKVAQAEDGSQKFSIVKIDQSKSECENKVLTEDSLLKDGFTSEKCKEDSRVINEAVRKDQHVLKDLLHVPSPVTKSDPKSFVEKSIQNDIVIPSSSSNLTIENLNVPCLDNTASLSETTKWECKSQQETVYKNTPEDNKHCVDMSARSHAEKSSIQAINLGCEKSKMQYESGTNDSNMKVLSKKHVSDVGVVSDDKPGSKCTGAVKTLQPQIAESSFQNIVPNLKTDQCRTTSGRNEVEIKISTSNQELMKRGNVVERGNTTTLEQEDKSANKSMKDPKITCSDKMLKTNLKLSSVSQKLIGPCETKMSVSSSSIESHKPVTESMRQSTGKISSKTEKELSDEKNVSKFCKDAENVIQPISSSENLKETNSGFPDGIVSCDSTKMKLPKSSLSTDEVEKKVTMPDIIKADSGHVDSKELSPNEKLHLKKEGENKQGSGTGDTKFSSDSSDAGILLGDSSKIIDASVSLKKYINDQSDIKDIQDVKPSETNDIPSSNTVCVSESVHDFEKGNSPDVQSVKSNELKSFPSLISSTCGASSHPSQTYVLSNLKKNVDKSSGSSKESILKSDEENNVLHSSSSNKDMLDDSKSHENMNLKISFIEKDVKNNKAVDSGISYRSSTYQKDGIIDNSVLTTKEHNLQGVSKTVEQKSKLIDTPVAQAGSRIDERSIGSSFQVNVTDQISGNVLGKTFSSSKDSEEYNKYSNTTLPIKVKLSGEEIVSSEITAASAVGLPACTSVSSNQDKKVMIDDKSDVSAKNPITRPKSPTNKTVMALPSKMKNEAQNKGRRKSLESISMGIMMGKLAAKSSFQERMSSATSSTIESLSLPCSEVASSDPASSVTCSELNISGEKQVEKRDERMPKATSTTISAVKFKSLDFDDQPKVYISSCESSQPIEFLDKKETLPPVEKKNASSLDSQKSNFDKKIATESQNRKNSDKYIHPKPGDVKDKKIKGRTSEERKEQIDGKIMEANIQSKDEVNQQSKIEKDTKISGEIYKKQTSDSNRIKEEDLHPNLPEKSEVNKSMNIEQKKDVFEHAKEGVNAEIKVSVISPAMKVLSDERKIRLNENESKEKFEQMERDCNVQVKECNQKKHDQLEKDNEQTKKIDTEKTKDVQNKEDERKKETNVHRKEVDVLKKKTDVQKKAVDVQEKGADLQKKEMNIQKKEKDAQKEEVDNQEKEKGAQKEEVDIQKKEVVIQKKEMDIQRKEMDVQKKEAGIQKKEKDVHKEEVDVQKKEVSIQKKEKDVQKEEVDVQKKEVSIQKKEKDVQKEEVDVQKKEASIQKKEKDVQKEQVDVQKKEASIQKKEKDVQKKQVDVQKKEVSIQKKEKDVQKEQVDVQKKEVSIQKEKEVIQKREKDIQKKDANVQKDVDVQKNEKDAQKEEEDIQKREMDIQNKEVDVQKKEENVQKKVGDTQKGEVGIHNEELDIQKEVVDVQKKEIDVQKREGDIQNKEADMQKKELDVLNMEVGEQKKVDDEMKNKGEQKKEVDEMKRKDEQKLKVDDKSMTELDQKKKTSVDFVEKQADNEKHSTLKKDASLVTESDISNNSTVILKDIKHSGVLSMSSKDEANDRSNKDGDIISPELQDPIIVREKLKVNESKNYENIEDKEHGVLQAEKEQKVSAESKKEECHNELLPEKNTSQERQESSSLENSRKRAKGSVRVLSDVRGNKDGRYDELAAKKIPEEKQKVISGKKMDKVTVAKSEVRSVRSLATDLPEAKESAEFSVQDCRNGSNKLVATCSNTETISESPTKVDTSQSKSRKVVDSLDVEICIPSNQILVSKLKASRKGSMASSSLNDPEHSENLKDQSSEKGADDDEYIFPDKSPQREEKLKVVDSENKTSESTTKHPGIEIVSDGGHISSSDGEDRMPEPIGTSEEGESEANVELQSKLSAPPRAKGTRGRRGRGRGWRGRSRIERFATNASPAPVFTEAPSKEEENSSAGSTPSKPKHGKRGKRAPKLLGLDVGVDIVLEQSREGDGKSGPPVRQSRRIAQMKIREEAERRKLEEMTLQQLKDEQSRRKAESKVAKKETLEAKKRKKKYIETDEDYTAEDVEEETSRKKLKKRKKRRKKKPALSFNESNPWKSSSGSSSSQEEEEVEQTEEEEEDDDEELIFKSDHEFSPESDLENDATEITPTKRARTAQKGQLCAEDEEEPADEHACQKCGKSDHPEWILLCDKCDAGWHGSCLRPALMVIPEGDWYCPPCEHTFLLDNLHKRILEFDRNWKRRENEELRKKRLAYVGISLDNVLPNKEREGSEGESDCKTKRELAGTPSGSESSGSESGSSGDESEPVYQLRERRQTLFSYRFNEYDDLINSAIQDEMEAVKGAGNQGRGKDISTIVKAEAEEIQASQKDDDEKEEEKVEIKPEEKQHPQTEILPEEMPHVVPKHEEKDEEEDDEDDFCPFKKFQTKKKHRRLNSLDISSEDDAESDEDFKGSSSDEEEDEYEEASEGDSDDTEFAGRRGKKGRKSSGPVRRSSRARVTRFDKEFINDDSEDSEPPKKKSRKLWQNSESEESDASWGRSKRPKKYITTFKTKERKKKKKRSKRGLDSDLETFKVKKPKIKYGGLNDDDDDEVSPTRRTRGRKINYQEFAASESEEETWGKARKLDSEEEYVANEDDDEDEELLAELEKDSENEFGGEPDESKKPNKSKPERRGRMKKSPKHAFEKGIRKGKRPGKPRKKAIIESDEDDDDDGQPDESAVLDTSGDVNNSAGTILSGNSVESSFSVVPCSAPPLDFPKEKRGRTRGQGKKQEEQKKKTRRKKRGEITDEDLLEPRIQKEQGLGQEVYAGQQLTEISLPPLTRGAGARKANEALMQRLNANSTTITLKPCPDLFTESDRTLGMQSAKGSMNTDPLRSLLAAPPVMIPEGEMKVGEDAPPPAGKRKGRGRGKAAASAAADISKTQDVGHYPLQGFPSGAGGTNNNSSVISRMLQTQPVSGTPQSFTAAAAAMGHKYFGNSTGESSMMPMQNAGRGAPSVPPYPGSPKGLQSQYRQPLPMDPSNPGMNAGMGHYGSSPPGRGSGIRAPPPNFQQTTSMRLRNPSPGTQPHMFHTSHHPMDPSPSGGGPIIIASSTGPPPPTGSPLTTKPGTPSTSHSTPTPPPPPYSRSGSQMPLAPPASTSMASMVPFPMQPGEAQPPGRHTPSSFPAATSASHLQSPQGAQQSPPPHQGRSPVPGNFSPYHPPPPANYHYGGYPPPPPMSAADDALPPSAFQGSPYTDHYTSSEMTTNLQASDGSNSKSYEEEGGGEFGGLVSYFSSQREDDLDT